MKRDIIYLDKGVGDLGVGILSTLDKAFLRMCLWWLELSKRIHGGGFSLKN